MGELNLDDLLQVVETLRDSRIDILDEFEGVEQYNERKALKHYGTPRHSGRYPWGSGENPYQHESYFMSEVTRMRKEGFTNNDIADAMNMTSGEFRARITSAKETIHNHQTTTAKELHEQGKSNIEIAKILEITEGTVRNLLREDGKLYKKSDSMSQTVDFLKKQVDAKGIIDIGKGSEKDVIILDKSSKPINSGISETALNAAVKKLVDQGYSAYGDLRVEQATNPGKYTSMKVLCPPGTTKQMAGIAVKTGQVRTIADYDRFAEIAEEKHPDFKRTKYGMYYPESVDSNRVSIRYAEEGGLAKDGVIEIRRGVDDLSLGKANYAQVRIAVDNKYYLKGMAMYMDDKTAASLPKGVDIIFNSHQVTGTEMGDVFKGLKKNKATGQIDEDNPFGAAIKPEDKGGQRFYIGEDGKEHLNCVNIVNKEGDWGDWGKTLSSQFLSKQPLALIQKQLNASYEQKLNEYNDICALTNPIIKQHFLSSFADDCDASAVHLKAVALPGQQAHVILPIDDLKPTEVYAPNYDNGQEVVLIRYPHEGIFEIPKLTVNNNHKTGQELLGQARDAIGINSATAEQLSGADFDGDTVMVIPVSKGRNGTHVSTMKTLEGLEGFRTDQYALPKDAPEVSVATGFHKQMEMGKVSNLITDMTLKGAGFDEIAKATKHSMVIIDAEKHHLDWRQSEIDNDIASLKEKYQGGAKKGASTLISKASSEERVDRRTVKYTDPDNPGSISNGINVLTGEKEYRYTNEVYHKPIYEYLRDENGKYVKDENGKKINVYETYINSEGKEVKKKKILGYSEKETKKQTKSTKMAEAKDAYELIENKIFDKTTGKWIAQYEKEGAYADYANSLKALANQARLELINTNSPKQSASAKAAYSAEVNSLNTKLAIAIKNKPRERQAQLAANVIFKMKQEDNPGMSHDEEKKIKSQALAEQRVRYGAKKEAIDITDREWEAIQSGAISAQKLRDIMANTDTDKLRERAMPKDRETNLSSAQLDMIRARSKNGYTAKEISNMMNLSTTTINNILLGKYDVEHSEESVDIQPLIN